MLDVDAISKTFGSLQAVSDLSFTAKPGTVFGLLGPNGAGKTTTIRMILDIITPDRGQVRWAGKTIDADVRHTFGYLPEERGLYPKMRVRDQLLFLAQLHGATVEAATKRIAELAAALNLTENFSKTPAELSKGNQQKVQFIAAVAHDPPLLVLDEPFSGFDPINVEVVKHAIRDLLARGTAVLLSSHRMEQVEELCEDICIIDRSRAVLSGDLREIKRSWPERFIRMTRLADTGFLDQFSGVAVMPGKDGFLDVKAPPSLSPADVLKAAMAAGPVDHFEVVEPSLNDIYLSAVKPEAVTA
ncbi:MAG TPA: ATP-binding cassette domain-containing protein [Candidatus Eremiobacteraceae bacterium]|nr:ATP-binding cassette domain-containing protein [Candidatus Eremiobacteraceae bacterium]